jgi:hypothetical protein
MVNLTIIPKDEREGMISSFWQMLQECEAKAANDNDRVLKHFVDQWYLQWNRVTNSNHKSRWAK